MKIGFDTSPLIYQLIAFGSVLGLGGFFFLYARKRTFPESLFLILATFCLFLFRFPVLVFNRELNVDESQMLAQALTLTTDPVYWRSVDGTTGGPLSSYFLVPVGLLMGRFDYIAAHTGAFILVLLTIFFLYLAFRNWFGPFRAALGVFPAILFYGFTKLPDFVHYSSEHFPVALLALCLWLLSSPGLTRPTALRYPAGFGILLALVPFGKIQAVPLAAVLALFGFYLFYKRQAWRSLLYCVAGGIATYLVIFAILGLNGVLADFFTYYIRANFLYKNDTGLWENIRFQLSQSLMATDMIILLAPLLTFPVFSRPPLRPALLWLGTLLFLAGVFAISRTGSGYLHYLLFMILPLSLLATCFTAKGSDISKKILAGYVAIPVLSAVVAFFVSYHKTEVLNPLPSGEIENRRIPFSETGEAASRYLSKGDFLVVWGWNCQYYVESRAPQGVAENHSIRSVFEHTMRDTYRARYLGDITRNRPVVFIDATGRNSLWLQDTLTQSYRSFPGLAGYIDQNYTLAERPEGNRLFVRNDIYKKE